MTEEEELDASVLRATHAIFRARVERLLILCGLAKLGKKPSDFPAFESEANGLQIEQMIAQKSDSPFVREMKEIMQDHDRILSQLRKHLGLLG